MANDAPEQESNKVVKADDRQVSEANVEGSDRLQQDAREGAQHLAGASLEKFFSTGEQLANAMGSPDLAASFNRMRALAAQADRTIAAEQNPERQSEMQKDWSKTQEGILKRDYSLVANFSDPARTKELMDKLKKNSSA